MSENIQVFIRIRPFIDRETSNERLVSSGHFIRATDEKTIEVRTSDTNIKCKYDQVFDPSFTQEQVYEKVKECTDSFLKGFNSTLFAYGQTGSGKSFTMFGAEMDHLKYRPGLTKSQAGIIPRAIKDIFAGLVQLENDAPQAMMVYCSFVQIYNENIFDLLRDGNMDRPLEIHEDRKNGIYVEGLSEYAVRNVNDCLNLLQCGEQNRAVRATHMNQVSSRSHSVFQLLLEQRKKDGTTVKSKFNLVDLAGSEKWNMEAQMMDHHISEMTNINLSLHTLGRCIAALSSTTTTSQHSTHVPYRDSKLTRLLQDSLGGNTKTKIIATLSPSLDCIEESISTLKFADRAKQVMVQVRINEQKEIDPAYVQKLEDEILQLRALVRTFQGKSGSGSTENSTESANNNNHNNHNDPAEIFLTSVASIQNGEDDQDTDLRAQLVRLIQENNELKHQLQRSRQNSIGNVIVGSNGGSGSISSPPELSVLQSTLKQLKDASDKFFKFEIEEEELKNIHDRLFKATLSSGTSNVGFSPAKSIGSSLLGNGSISPLTSSASSTSKPRTCKYSFFFFFFFVYVYGVSI
jgi:kinesin family protein 3/17